MEQNVGQGEVEIQVVVADGVVLRGVEDLEQGRGRVAPVIRTHLVDLVQQHNGIHRPRLADGTHDATRQRTDVGTAVTADLRLVTHTAEGDAHELATQRPSDALTE